MNFLSRTLCLTYCGVQYYTVRSRLTATLFRKKRFEINFFVRQNASKFAIFIEKKTHLVFFIFHFEQLWVFPYECPGLCDINRGIHRVKLKNALNENRKKLRRFSFSINMTNYETFCRTKKLISNLFFLKSNMK